MPSTRNQKIEDIMDLLARLPRAIRKSTEHDIFKPLLQSIDRSLSPHHMIIMKTIDEEGILHISKIGDSIMISKAQMTQSIDKLIKSGMLERRADPRDRRKIDIILTKKGEKAVDLFDAAVKKQMKDSLSWLNDEGLDKMVDSLRYILKTMEKF
jgi:MarR family transcriptional regulator, organic hydroperoxide resistance regulator